MSFVGVEIGSQTIERMSCGYTETPLTQWAFEGLEMGVRIVGDADSCRLSGPNILLAERCCTGSP